MIRVRDTGRFKQFRRGIAQLDEEGVVQVLRDADVGDQAPILAAVGPMQFEVAVHRLENEFGAPVELSPTSYRLARRTDAAGAEALKGMRGRAGRASRRRHHAGPVREPVLGGAAGGRSSPTCCWSAWWPRAASGRPAGDTSRTGGHMARGSAHWRAGGIAGVVLVLLAAACTSSGSSPSAAPETTLPPLQGLVTGITLPGGDACEFFNQGNCLLPFPSNHFTRPDPSTPTGVRVAFTREDMPVNVDGVPIDPTEWNRNDGFSPGGPIITQATGVDLAASGAPPITDIARSLDDDSPIVLLDADTGERRPFFAELDSHAPAASAQQALIIRPAVNLTEGHRYVVALRNLKRADGSALDPQPAFAAYRDRTRTDVPAIEARRDAMESIFATLGAAGVDRHDLYVAWDFTVASTANLTGRVLAMRDDAFASLAGRAPAFAVTSTEDNPDRAATGWSRVVKGTVDVPSYLTGTGDAGTMLNNGTDPAGIPTRNGTLKVPFTCVIPRGAAAHPEPTVLYGHGLLGSQEEGEGVGKGVGDQLGVNVCAVDWIGMAQGDLAAIVVDAEGPERLPHHPRPPPAVVRQLPLPGSRRQGGRRLRRQPGLPDRGWRPGHERRGGLRGQQPRAASSAGR